MWERLKHWRDRYEAFLRIDASLNAETIMRARIIYTTGCLFLGLQLCNMVSMYVIYDGWDLQHVIALGACAVFLSVTQLLRWTKSPRVFGTIYMILPLVAIGGSALSGSNETVATGINTPLLPLLPISLVFLAFIGTRLISLTYLALGIAMIIGLYYFSVAGGVDDIAHIILYQRAAQGVLCMLIVGMSFPFTTHLLFANLAALEDTVVRAREAEAAKTELIGTMSHEIRTPLNGVIAMADMVSRAEMDVDTRASLNLLQRSADSLLDLLNGVLDRAKSEHTEFSLTTAPFDPAELMEDITGLFAAAARDKGVWIGTHGTDQLPKRLLGDAAHLRQVLNNLVGNAVKFTPNGGIRLGATVGEVENGAADVLFFVQDTGLGIAPDDQSRIFDRFEQSASAQQSDTKGTGLGLAICQDIVAAMGGQLALQSQVGRGSTFHFTLRLGVQQDAGTLAA